MPTNCGVYEPDQLYDLQGVLNDYIVAFLTKFAAFRPMKIVWYPM